MMLTDEAIIISGVTIKGNIPPQKMPHDFYEQTVSNLKEIPNMCPIIKNIEFKPKKNNYFSIYFKVVLNNGLLMNCSVRTHKIKKSIRRKTSAEKIRLYYMTRIPSWDILIDRIVADALYAQSLIDTDTFIPGKTPYLQRETNR